MFPGQIVVDAGDTVKLGTGFTTKVPEEELLQTPLYPVIVYEVDTVGLAITTEPVEELKVADGDHE